jgi:hypothetical protein
MRPFLTAVLAASLVLAPTASVAAGTPAPPPVDAQARAGADLQDPNQINRNWLWIGGGLLLLLILLLVVLDDDDEDAPVSP